MLSAISKTLSIRLHSVAPYFSMLDMEEHQHLLKVMGSQRIHSQGVPGLHKMKILMQTQAGLCFYHFPPENLSRNMEFAEFPDAIRNTEGQYKAGEHRTDLCVGWAGYCQAVSLQLQVEEWYSWCCWMPPGHSSHSQGRTRCLKSWPSPQGQEVHFGEADVFVTEILRNQRCWKTLSLTERHNHSYEVPKSPSDTSHT